jgi:predicted RNA binding protein YcfA (HicA-like mRNA interferase family)
LNYRELTKKLRRLECEFVRHAAGSHEIWWRPSNSRFTTIPHHGSRDLAEGTLRAILRDLRIDKKELKNA